MEKKLAYEIRQIDAWCVDESDGPDWTWNDSFHVGDMETRTKDEKKAFANWLHKHNVFWDRRLHIIYDGDLFILEIRKTGKPLYAAIPRF